MFKVSNKAPERHQLRFSGVFIVNFEHVLRLFQVFLWLALNKLILAGQFFLISIIKSLK